MTNNTNAIMKDRLSRVIKGMQAMELDQILVTATDSIFYLTGLWIAPGERMLALKVDSSGGMHLYVNHMLTPGEMPEGCKAVYFDDADDALGILAGDISRGQLGIDKYWPSRFTLGLQEKRSDVKLVLGSAPVDDARMIKDAAELDAMRKASRLNDQVVGAIKHTLIEGEREIDVARRFEQMGIDAGARCPSFTPLICFGKNAAEPHHGTDATHLEKGMPVILDLGLDVDHYMSDMTRTVFFGSVTDEEKKVYEIVLAANLAAKSVARPGIPMRDIDRAARKVIEDAGYGQYFIHRTGHGIGLAVHEPPDASAVSDIIARPGMVFSIEPGIYLPNKFGVRIEDLIAITQDGYECLNELDRTLEVV